jgi:hypothetical protein
MVSRVLSSRLVQVPVAIEAEWHGREYATRRPRAASYDQWRAEFRIVSDLAEILLVLVLRDAHRSTFCKLHRGGASNACSVSLTFMWHDWGSSDLIRLSLAEGAAVAQLDVEDRELGTDPQRFVDLPLESSQAVTGSVLTLATIDRVHVCAEAVCIAKSDTVNTHGRWALKPDLREGIEDAYAFLSSGAVSG